MDLSWYRFETDAETLASKIRASEVEYESMLCIARGGLILGGYLANLLSFRKLRTISLQYYKGQRRGGDVVELIPPEISTLGGKILLVDDLIDSGKTVKYVIDKYGHLCSFDVGVLYDKGGGQIRPTYLVDKVPSEDWITFPWEVSGD